MPTSGINRPLSLRERVGVRGISATRSLSDLLQAAEATIVGVPNHSQLAPTGATA